MGLEGVVAKWTRLRYRPGMLSSHDQDEARGKCVPGVTVFKSVNGIFPECRQPARQPLLAGQKGEA